MANIDLRDPNTQELYAKLGQALGLLGYEATPGARQDRAILGQKRNADQLALLQDTASKLDPEHQQEFLKKNEKLFEKLGSPLGKEVISPAKPASDLQIQDYVANALKDRFPQANMNPLGTFNPTTDLRSILSGTQAEAAVPGIRAEAAANAGTPAVLGDRLSINLPLNFQQVGSDLKSKIGKGPQDNVRYQDLKNLGFDVDTLLKPSGNNVLAANIFGVDKVQALGLDPSTTTAGIYLKQVQQLQDAKKWDEDRKDRNKHFNILQSRLEKDFGVQTAKTVNEGLASLEMKLDDPKTSDQDRKLLVDQMNNLSGLIGDKQFKSVPKEGLMAGISRILGNDPTQVIKLVGAMQSDINKKGTGKETADERAKKKFLKK